jgi:hypothetical protein
MKFCNLLPLLIFAIGNACVAQTAGENHHKDIILDSLLDKLPIEVVLRSTPKQRLADGLKIEIEINNKTGKPVSITTVDKDVPVRLMILNANNVDINMYNEPSSPMPLKVMKFAPNETKTFQVVLKKYPNSKGKMANVQKGSYKISAILGVTNEDEEHRYIDNVNTKWLDVKLE